MGDEKPPSIRLPEQITDRFLRSLRKQFYVGLDKAYYQQRRQLILAITFPAYWLDERAVRLPAHRYTGILTHIIRTVVREGDLANVHHFGFYFLKSVQNHMRHQGETYYDEGKVTRHLAADTMAGIQRLQATAKSKAAAQATTIDRTVPALAEAHRVLSAAKPTRRKTTARRKPEQGTLF
ncbi:MAG TPA: hypothetical protein VNQ90_15100 [Chthoniobacteraceae bacterium]|nr:hypothetical protein [Chthoniobacteraceae bacterium]